MHGHKNIPPAIRYFLALLWAHPILHISTIRVKEETNLLHLPGSEPTYLSLSARQLVTTPNTVSRFTVVILSVVLCEDEKPVSQITRTEYENIRKQDAGENTWTWNTGIYRRLEETA